jgi:hypothetical protein
MEIADISTTWRFVWRVLGRAGQFVGTVILVIGQLMDPITTMIGATLLCIGAILDIGLDLIGSK